MPLISDEPLNDNEIKELHAFLSFPHEDAKPMSLTECHGFLTAIVSAPTLIMPSQWQPVLFGGQPTFASMDEATTIIQLIGRFNNQISSKLRKDKPFEPFIFNADKIEIIPYLEASFEAIGEWCKGYLQGSKIDSLWYLDEMAVANLFPFGVFAGKIDIRGEKGIDGKVIEYDIQHKSRYKQNLPAYIKDFFNHWQEHRKISVPVPDFIIRDGDTTYEINRDMFYRKEPIRNPHKIGRNDICSCGSGKKYKRCCLAKDLVIH